MARRAAFARRWLLTALAFAGVLSGFFAGRFDAAALAAGPKTSPRSGARWHIVETASFRILSYGATPVSPQTAEACERVRDQLTRQWLSNAPGLSDAPAEAWSPKCDLVLHATDAAYLREVGGGGRGTVASALVDRQRGRIALRRIDIRSTRSDWLTSALAHELAHVVLCDRFVLEALPRWLDEGIAIQADPHHKRQQHQRDLERAVARGLQFRVAELFALADYPPADRWGTFYGQSASLVAYLVAQQGHQRFVEFVELSQQRGYDDALRRVYRFGIGELERRWHAELTAPSATASHRQPPNPQPESTVTSSAG
ncbi:MAG: peptidase MA family metallohydrolase [Pirellulales bacterium]